MSSSQTQLVESQQATPLQETKTDTHNSDQNKNNGSTNNNDNTNKDNTNNDEEHNRQTITDRFQRPKIPEAPEGKSLLLTGKTIIFHSNLNKSNSLRPGGINAPPKEYTSQMSRKSRRKKLGSNRVSYDIQQLLKMRDQYRKFPLNVETIENVFEEGIGPEEIGQIIGKEEEIVEEEKSIDEDIKRKHKPNVADKLPPSDEPKTSGEKPKRASGGWVPHALRSSNSVDPMQESSRIIRGSLNKITLDNFETLKEQLIHVFTNKINETRELELLVSLIFEKTVIEPLFSPLYAKLCVELSNKHKEFESEIIDKVTGEKTVKKVGFKSILVKQCEKEFRKGIVQPNILPDMKPEDKEFAFMRQKKISMGTMQFIGQLYNHDLLIAGIMTNCLQTLIGGTDAVYPSVDDIEAACVLLQTIGAKLDKEDLRVMPSYYRKLQGLQSDEKNYPPRIRILIRNLFDLKRNGWKSNTEVILKTVKEVHAEWNQQHGININIPDLSRTSNNAANASNNNVNTIGAADDPTAIGDEDGSFRFLHGTDANINSLLGGKQNDIEIIHGGAIPISGDALSKAHSKHIHRSRYNTQKNNSNINDNNNNNQQISSGTQLRYPRQQSATKVDKNKYLLKSKTIFDTEEKDNKSYVSSNLNTKEVNIVPKKTNTIARPGSNGPPLDFEKFNEWLKLYLDGKMNKQQIIGKISNFQINVNELINEILRVSLDVEPSMKNSADLIIELFSQKFITSDEFNTFMNSFFEEFTDCLIDCPKLNDQLSSWLVYLIKNEKKIISVQNIDEWLTNTQYVMGQFDKNILQGMFTYSLLFLNSFIRTLKDSAGGNSNYVRQLLISNNFNFDKYFKNDEMKKNFIEQFRLDWYFKY